MKLHTSKHLLPPIYALISWHDERIAIKREFFEKIKEVLTNIGSNREIIMLGDLNSRTGCQKDNE